MIKCGTYVAFLMEKWRKIKHLTRLFSLAKNISRLHELGIFNTLEGRCDGNYIQLPSHETTVWAIYEVKSHFS